MTLNKFLKYFTVAGVFILPAVVPFVVASSFFFPFITGKGFTFRIITEIIFAVWVLLALRDVNFRPKKSLILVVSGFFIVVLALADSFAENPFKAFWSNFERMEGFVALFHFFVYFLVAGSVMNTERLWTNFFRVSILASMVMSFYGFLQLAGKIVINQGGVRLDGTFGNATYFAGYMLFNFFLAAFLLLREKKNYIRVLYVVAMLIQLTMIYFTATRGALLAFIGGSVLTFGIIAVFEKERKTLRKISTGVLVAIVVFAGLLFSFRDSSFVKKYDALARISSISAGSSDAQARFMVWNMAWQGVKERPVLGWGQEGFNFIFNKYYNPLMHGREQWFDRTHNIIFDWLVSAGFLGLGFYLLLLLSAILTALGYRPGFLKKIFGEQAGGFSVADKAVLVGLVASYFVQNFFVFDNAVSYMMFFSVLAYLHSRVSSPIVSISNKKTEIDQASFMQVALPIVVVVLVLVVYFVNVRSVRVAVNLIKALQPQSGGINENLNYYKGILAHRSIGEQESREQLVQAGSSVARSNLPAEQRSAFILFAKSEAEKQVKSVPTDARARIFYASVLTATGEYDEAIKQYEEGYRLSPYKQSMAMELNQLYLTKGIYDKALALMKEIFEKAPIHEDVRIAYAMSAIYAGKNDLAEDLLLNSEYKTVLVPDRKIIQAYYATKQYDKAIKILKEMIAKNPNDEQNHISLSIIYLNQGSRELAVSELKKAAEIKPDLKQEIDYYIGEIRAGRNP